MHKVFNLLLLTGAVILSACSPTDKGAAKTSIISGTLTGLSGGSLALQHNGDDIFSLSADGSFSADISGTAGSPSDIAVLTQPSSPPQLCSVDEGSATVEGSNITNVLVNCVNTGKFKGTPIQGLAYSTATLSGIMGASGDFYFDDSETVSLYLGDLFLGEAEGASEITLFDLVDGVTPLIGRANISNGTDSRSDGPDFQTVMNLATTLQTMDYDGNPDNGIEIKADIAELFTQSSIDFNQSYSKLGYDPGFRQALTEANANTLLQSHRQIRPPWLVMSHLYESMGIDPKLPVIGSSSYYSDGDLTPNRVFTYSYDTNGNVTREEYDYDGDGTPNSIITIGYDVNGNQTRQERDVDGDGTPNNILTFSHNANGDPTRLEVDDDGTPSYVGTYSYDANGNLTRIEEDNDGDGTPSRIDTLSYDAYGNLARVEEDEDGNGTPNRIETYSYDANGNKTRRENDVNGDGDGTPNEISTYSYDANGNETRYEYDRDGDGTPNEVFTSSYDANGHLTRFEADHYGDGAGTPNEISIYSYDANGNVTREERGYDGHNGIITYSYDANGNLTREEDDYDGDGTPNQISTYSYDANGYETRDEYDSDGDPSTPNSVSITSYVNVDGWVRFFVDVYDI